MGFSDLLTSSRGPGVIGTLLALLVLVGFGTLYLFVFDEGLQGGGKKIEAVIRDNATVIASNSRQVEDFKKRIEEGQRFKDQGREIEQLKIRLSKGEETISAKTGEREAGIGAVAAAEQAWENYKDAYRASEWASAEGEKLAELRTLSGKTYTDVVVTGVDHTGMRIMISSGPMTVGSSDLPLGLQDRFQFSAAKKKIVEGERRNDFEELTGDVELATLAQKGKDILEKIRLKAADIEETGEKIQTFTAAEPLLLRRVDAIRAELAEEQAKTASRSGRRARGINRTPQIREMLRVAENKVSSNRKSIAEFEKRIRENQREVRQLEREVDGVKINITKLKKEREAKKAEALQSAQ